METGQTEVINATVETEKQLLLEKNTALTAKMDSLQAQNGELLARLETMELKLKVAELEAKLKTVELEAKLANEQTAKTFEEKMAELTGHLAEKLMNKMAEENSKLQKQLCDMSENQQKFMDNKDVGTKLEMMAKQLDQGIADLGGKMAALGNQFKSVWCYNRWDNNTSDGQEVVELSADALTATAEQCYAIVRAQQPISRQILASIHGLPVVYFEVLLKNTRLPWIGWANADFPLDHEEFWTCKHPGLYGINYHGDHSQLGYGWGIDGFNSGDVVGSGLVLSLDGKPKMFFTKNGRLNGNSFAMDDSQDPLYPIVFFSRKFPSSSVEANFGADSGKPFKQQHTLYIISIICPLQETQNFF